MDTIFYGYWSNLTQMIKFLFLKDLKREKVAAQAMRDSFNEADGHDYSDKSDAEMLDAIVYNVFPNFSPWGGFPRNLIYRFGPNGNREGFMYNGSNLFAKKS